MQSLKNQHVIVTGGSSGLGLGVVEALVERGSAFTVTASLGTAVVPDDATSPSAALQLADCADRVLDDIATTAAVLAGPDSAVGGSVRVTEQMIVERYSHVMHLVSHVTARLAANKTAYDAMRATFPAGTVSGAPKIRAMQIINDLEQEKRGCYAGAVGYFGFDGALDCCIALRSVVLKNNRAYVQAGAGIVADSNPSAEYKETLSKAMATVEAIGRAAEISS